MVDDQAEFCAEFAKQLYGTVAMEDLSAWTIDDLYGAVVNFWSLISERAPHETKFVSIIQTMNVMDGKRRIQ